jgi:hypothetical protein
MTNGRNQLLPVRMFRNWICADKDALDSKVECRKYITTSVGSVTITDGKLTYITINPVRSYEIRTLKEFDNWYKAVQAFREQIISELEAR